MAAQYLTGDRLFVTYGDGVGDIDIGALLRFHLFNERLYLHRTKQDVSPYVD